MTNPMFSYDEQMTEMVLEYCRERLELKNVPLDFTGEKPVLDHAVEGLIGAGPHDAREVLSVFTEKLAPAVLSVDSPRYISFIPAAPTKASLLMDMIVSCSSMAATSWLESSGAVTAENQALRAIADMAGLPAGAGGVFVSGGSAANLSALVVARDMGARRLGEGHRGRLRAAVSDQAHSSVGKALHVIGMDALVVPTADHRLDAASLEATLDADPSPESVVAVVATSGTTNAGIIDDLRGVGEIASARDLWFHVDGAYGAAAIFSARHRPRFAGLQMADSMVVDPHKWLYAPFDCAALLYREPRFAKAVHTQDAGYLDVLHTAEEDWNPSDYAYHLTRRARGLAMWFSLAVYGTDAYGAAIDAAVETALASAELIRRTPYLELIRDPELSVVLFRRSGWEEKDYYRWSAKLLGDQIGFVTPSVWEGETIARFAFLHPDTTMEIVEQVVATMA